MVDLGLCSESIWNQFSSIIGARPPRAKEQEAPFCLSFVDISQLDAIFE